MTLDASRDSDMFATYCGVVFVVFGDVGPAFFFDHDMYRTKSSCAKVLEIYTAGALMCRSVLTPSRSSRTLLSLSITHTIPRMASLTQAPSTLLKDTPLQCRTQQVANFASVQTKRPVATTHADQTTSKILRTYPHGSSRLSCHTRTTMVSLTPHTHMTRPGIMTPHL